MNTLKAKIIPYIKCPYCREEYSVVSWNDATEDYFGEIDTPIDSEDISDALFTCPSGNCIKHIAGTKFN